MSIGWLGQLQFLLEKRGSVMNKKHLGDAIDYWKRAMLDLFGSEVKRLRVVPMFTDGKWSRRDLDLYARVLHVKCPQILKHDKQFTHEGRRDYFASLNTAASYDVFLDPDTGVEPGCGSACERHVTVHELEQMLSTAPGRVLFVYQHAHRKNDWASDALDRLAEINGTPRCWRFAYDAGSVAMLVVSRDKERVKRLHARIIIHLHGSSDARKRLTELRGSPSARQVRCGAARA